MESLLKWTLWLWGTTKLGPLCQRIKKRDCFRMEKLEKTSFPSNKCCSLNSTYRVNWILAHTCPHPVTLCKTQLGQLCMAFLLHMGLRSHSYCYSSSLLLSHSCHYHGVPFLPTSELSLYIFIFSFQDFVDMVLRALQSV